MATIWDNVVASATRAATQAGEATQVAATKAKLHADLLVIDRDVNARMEKFGVEMYAHLESITSTQEFYVADDRLIEIIRPTLIKAQREVAAYERKRDAMKGKVNAAEANRSATGSIFTANSIGEKLMNAAKFAAAGAKEAATKTELAMLERQILGFKEEFGRELYPVFEGMEDNEGWLPTDRKVRSLYDGAREDMAKMQKSKEEKREQIRRLDGLEGSGLTPPTLAPTQGEAAPTPTVMGIPVPSVKNNQQSLGSGQAPWASATPTVTARPAPPSNGYGSSQTPPTMQAASFGSMDQNTQLPPQQMHQPPGGGGFGFMQSQPNNAVQPTVEMQQYSNNPVQPTPAQQPHQNLGGVFDPFDGIGGSNAAAPVNAGSSFGSSYSAAPSAQPGHNAFDPFSGANGQNGGAKPLNDADMNLFKY
mmetsp:Transcript_2256/g.4893  ORF Transcript_2256/g.4893 Transcript_2256/m.4893 type:complete len:421 (-) Transcript_2256:455-1717(-)